MTHSPLELLRDEVEAPPRQQEFPVDHASMRNFAPEAPAFGVMRDREHWLVELVGAFLGLIVAGVAIALGAIAIAYMWCASMLIRIASWFNRSPT